MKYTPVSNDVTKFSAKRARGFDPNKTKQSDKGQYETPQMTGPGVPTANPVTKGDRTSGKGRYERGRIDKSRS